MKIRITQKPESKLAFVKILKFNSSHDLRQAKDIADWMFDNLSRSIDINMTDEQARKANQEMINENIKGVIFSYSEERNLNILKLGIGEKEDYIDILAEYLVSSDLETIKNILATLNKDTLIQLCEKVTL